MTTALEVISQIRTKIKTAAPSLTDVYNLTAPDEAKFPYAVIGELQRLPYDTKTTVENQFFINIHIWTRSSSATQAYTLLDAIKNGLHRSMLNNLEQVLLLSDRVLTDPSDTNIQHGVIRFRIF